MDKQPLTSVAQKEIAKIPGAEPQARMDPWWWLVALVAGLVVLLVIFRPDPYKRILIFVADGIVVTILVTIVSFTFVLIFGLIGGLGRISKNKVIYGFFSLYVEII